MSLYIELVKLTQFYTWSLH